MERFVSRCHISLPYNTADCLLKGDEYITKASTKAGKLTEGSITAGLFSFMWPILLSTLLSSFYNTADMIIIGHFVGNVGMAAVTVGGKLMDLLTHLAVGLATGGQILIAQQSGAGFEDKTRTTVGTLFVLMLSSSIAISALCILCSGSIMTWLRAPKEAFAAARSYFVITSAGLPLVFGYNAISGILRGMGDSLRSLYFIAIASVLNLILDIVFIVCFGMGVKGTAYATIIGQGVSFLLAGAFLLRRVKIFETVEGQKSFCAATAGRIFMIGMPLSASAVMINGTQLFISRYVNTLGVTATSVFGIGEKLILFTNSITSSTKNAGGTVAAQNIGAGRNDRVELTVHAVMKITFSVAALLSVFLLIFPNTVFSLFTNDAEIMTYSRSFTLITTLTLFLSAFMGSFEIVTIGTGSSMLSFVGCVLDGVVLRIFFSFFLGMWLNWGVTGYFLANTLSRLGPCAVHSTYYLSGKWKKKNSIMSGL